MFYPLSAAQILDDSLGILRGLGAIEFEDLILSDVREVKTGDRVLVDVDLHS
jgi:hypothetical protein